MTLNGKQPLATLTLTMNYADAKKLGIDLEELSPRLQEASQALLTTIHSDVTIVDVARSAAFATSFTAGSNPPPQIEAVFQAYENQPSKKGLTSEQREKEKSAILEVERRKKALREVEIRGYFLKGVISNIMLGTGLKVSHIDFMDKIVTFKLAE